MRPILEIWNNHSVNSGEPPFITNRYRNKKKYEGGEWANWVSYFENEYGEQALLIYNPGFEEVKLWMGDYSWIDDVKLNLKKPVLEQIRNCFRMVTREEELWLKACWDTLLKKQKVHEDIIKSIGEKGRERFNKSIVK